MRLNKLAEPLNFQSQIWDLKTGPIFFEIWVAFNDSEDICAGVKNKDNRTAY